MVLSVVQSQAVNVLSTFEVRPLSVLYKCVSERYIGISISHMSKMNCFST